MMVLVNCLDTIDCIIARQQSSKSITCATVAFTITRSCVITFPSDNGFRDEGIDYLKLHRLARIVYFFQRKVHCLVHLKCALVLIWFV